MKNEENEEIIYMKEATRMVCYIADKYENDHMPRNNY
jgi:hypothetical protein